MNRAPWLLATLMLAVGCDSDPSATVDPDSGMPAAPIDGASPATDGGPAATDRAPGQSCSCDDECAGTTANPGVCLQGICMQRATGDCAEAGSSGECPAGARCWGLDGVPGGICWPDCDAHSCDGSCDADGSCVPTESSSCDASCSAICSDGGGGDGCPPNSSLNAAGDGCVCDEGYTVSEDMTACVPACAEPTDCADGLVCEDGRCEEPPCTVGSCPTGTMCASSGDCVVDIGTPPPGPPPTCAAGAGTVPDWRCTGDASYCGELLAFEPKTGPGWWDYPLNGETESNQYRSYLRRDVMMLVQYAAAMVECQASEWTVGNGGALGLGDMSEADGAIPGTSDGSPGHPEGTHVNGHDIDIAYYQTGTSDNRLRSVCAHTSGGEDAYHCTGEPTMLDPWRTALFLGHLHASPQVRVIGVDGRVGPLVDSALTQLCADGWVSGAGCGSHSITWEETDTGRGWFYFHHHHLHLSVSAP